MRLFIAIELENKILEYIDQKQKTVQSKCTGGNFTRKENLHLTLRFLREITSEQIVRVKRVLADVASKSGPLFIGLGIY